MLVRPAAAARFTPAAVTVSMQNSAQTKVNSRDAVCRGCISGAETAGGASGGGGASPGGGRGIICCSVFSVQAGCYQTFLSVIYNRSFVRP